MESKTPRTDGRAGGRKEATMSDTPRSINHCDCGADKSHCFDCLFEVSCQLERELTEAQAEAAALRAENIRLLVRCDEKFDIIDNKDALIRQMREALRLALTECWSTCCENEIRAALSAAERINK